MASGSVLILAVALPFGCSKKAGDTPTPTAGSQPASAANPAPAQDAQSADATPQAPSGPVLDTSQLQGDAKQAMADADAAIRQREYEKAARTLMAIQQAQLNAQQAAAARQQMISFQRTLANAVASGDPNAKAAADLLRASHTR